LAAKIVDIAGYTTGFTSPYGTRPTVSRGMADAFNRKAHYAMSPLDDVECLIHSFICLIDDRLKVVAQARATFAAVVPYDKLDAVWAEHKCGLGFYEGTARVILPVLLDFARSVRGGILLSQLPASGGTVALSSAHPPESTLLSASSSVVAAAHRDTATASPATLTVATSSAATHVGTGSLVVIPSTTSALASTGATTATSAMTMSPSASGV